MAYNKNVKVGGKSMPNNQPQPATHSTAGLALWLRAILSLGIVLMTMGGLLFGSAGTLAWPAAWALIFAYGLFLLGFMGWGLTRNPELLRERGRVADNVKVWDKWINALYTLLLLVLLIISGLDARRFHWTSVPLFVQILAGICIVLAAWLIFRTIAENAYLSRWARIQDDRGQRVINTGPYAVVRHPMYAGIIILMVGMPLALGSLWGVVPGVMIGMLYIVRTALEDRMLMDELEGYRAYASTVRYRLIPRIW
jgi:protein-S-isoprenylcysteine O-methyltransferase Ste14